jgi:hypothetical protein
MMIEVCHALLHFGFVASTYAPEETQTVNAHGNREMPLSSPRRMLETLAEGLLPTIILG